MPDSPPESRWTNAPPQAGPAQRRLKLIVFIAIFGPMVLFGLYHMGRGVQKMIAGDPVGYRSTTERQAE